MKLLKYTILLCFISVQTISFSQDFKWKSELNFFFDNTEFSKSSYTNDQTMAGVTITQLFGWQFETNHSFYGGVDAMKSLGSHEILDDVHLLAYYEFANKNTVFNVGAFHRHDLLNDYSSFFFQDSIAYYKHTMDGMYFRKGDDNRFVKLWLDWTGLQSETERESFFLGASAFSSISSNFFADFQSYMFHYAGTNPVNPEYSVNDNLLAQASVGYAYHNSTGLNKLMFSVGALAGYERNRGTDISYSPVGLTARADIEYKKLGMENLVYAGQQRMRLYNDLGNDFYWGSPFLRGKFYWQNKLYWNVFNTEHVSGRFAIKNHISEGKLMFEQLFTLSAHIGN